MGKQGHMGEGDKYKHVRRPTHPFQTAMGPECCGLITQALMTTFSYL